MASKSPRGPEDISREQFHKQLNVIIGRGKKLEFPQPEGMADVRPKVERDLAFILHKGDVSEEDPYTVKIPKREGDEIGQLQYRTISPEQEKGLKIKDLEEEGIYTCDLLELLATCKHFHVPIPPKHAKAAGIENTQQQKHIR